MFLPWRTASGNTGLTSLRLPASRRRILTFLPALGLLTPVAVAQNPINPAVPDAAIAAVRPALVRIQVAEADCSRGREGKSESSGSGVILSADGMVVTNHHVAGQAKRLVCTLTDRTEVEADLVGTDPMTDISVIKLRPRKAGAYPFARWGDSSRLKVGDTVLAMGSPMSLSQSVTLGIVSNTELVMPSFASASLVLQGEDVGSMVRWIGHDASISPGNSGGPLVNLAGEVVGINEISVGLAGAIPGNLARSVADEIVKSGKVRRAWMGFTTQPLLKSRSETGGVLIGGVLPSGPAGKAGLKSGDVLTRLDGKDVSVRFGEEMPAFNQAVAALPIGKSVPLVVLRDGKEVRLTVTPDERAEAQPKPHEERGWGICVSDIPVLEALRRKRPDTLGVLVYSARPGGPSAAAKPAIVDRDLILEVNGRPVENAAVFADLTRAITQDSTDPVPTLVTLEREGERLVTVVKVGTTDLEDPGREARKAYLPISTQVLTPEIALALNLEGRKGFRVTRVDPDSTATRAGLEVGDVILSVDGQDLEASQPEDSEILPELIRQYDVGATAELSILRDGKPQKISVELVASPLSPREMRRYRDENFEFTVRDLAYMDSSTQKVAEGVTGVYVEEVSEGGWAALSRLAVGDVIRSVDGIPTPDVPTLRGVMNKAAETKPEYLVLHVARGIQAFYVEMEADWSASK